ncbi:MAG TPA: SIMPL domain-containing protein [Gemmatimonadaceae bacterium]|nr:SIMPL domain-containing protein [Gemmatimonadaceae bacterium]
MSRSLIACIGGLLLPASISLAQIPTERRPEIAASGRGEMRVSPTLASVTMSVTTKAPTAAEAARTNTATIVTAVTAIRAAGIATGDIVVLGYNIGQGNVYNPGPQRTEGILARNTIRVEIRKLDDLGKIIDAALAGGATEISSIQFSAPATAAARRAALASAVSGARADAEVMATAAGGRLGELISMGPGEAGFSGQADFSGRSAIFPGNLPPPTANISPRDITVTANVTGRWVFLPGNR